MINQYIDQRGKYYIFYIEKEGYKIVTIENGIVLREGLKTIIDVDKAIRELKKDVSTLKRIYHQAEI